MWKNNLWITVKKNQFFAGCGKPDFFNSIHVEKNPYCPKAKDGFPQKIVLLLLLLPNIFLLYIFFIDFTETRFLLCVLPVKKVC